MAPGLGRAGPCPPLAAAAAHNPGSKFKASALTGDLWLPGKPMPPPPVHTEGLARSLGGTHFKPVTFCLRVTPQTERMAWDEGLITPGLCNGASCQGVSLPSSSLLGSGSLLAGLSVSDKNSFIVIIVLQINISSRKDLVRSGIQQHVWADPFI